MITLAARRLRPIQIASGKPMITAMKTETSVTMSRSIESSQ